ncbi:MAG: hypothetical protein RI894_1118 [Bacteroidota bacterium]|jgi:hypothetical protein
MQKQNSKRLQTKIIKILFYNDYNERVGGAERFLNDAVLQLLSQQEVSIKSCVFDTKEESAANNISLLTRATCFIQKNQTKSYCN